jgi:predicted Zn-ribbon and HTH transcriptional regulator
VHRPALEVADIFRDHGAAWRSANAGHVSLDQLKVMSAIERCRTAALGGHVARCEDCAHTLIAYNSCRNRHCPKCQGAAAREWLAERDFVPWRFSAAVPVAWPLAARAAVKGAANWLDNSWFCSLDVARIGSGIVREEQSGHGRRPE